MIERQESLTAKLCSFARAYHSSYEKQKIFDDYLAYDLMGKEQYEWVGRLIENNFVVKDFQTANGFQKEKIYPELNRLLSPIPLSRIAFAEQELLSFAKENKKCQYVICGAGMDTFSFRNENPNIRIFELDHPDTQAYKLKRIQQLEWNIPENVTFLPLDFSKDDLSTRLLQTSYDRSIPAFFSILGVTYYLTLPIFDQTVEKISKIAAPGSKIVFDFPDETAFQKSTSQRFRRLREITDQLGEPMLHGFSTEEMENCLTCHHFYPTLHETPLLIQNRFFEKRADQQRAFENIHFLLAVKEDVPLDHPPVF